jgi:hypothetical protein
MLSRAAQRLQARRDLMNLEVVLVGTAASQSKENAGLLKKMRAELEKRAHG